MLCGSASQLKMQAGGVRKDYVGATVQSMVGLPVLQTSDTISPQWQLGYVWLMHFEGASVTKASASKHAVHRRR